MPKAKLGSGARFIALKNNVAKSEEKKGVSEKEAEKIGAATAAKRGIAKYGQKKMTAMAKAGKKRKSK